MWRPPAAAVALAALSLLVVAPAPAYDPWMWLLWGREVAEGGLDTREGPAFKPLTVALCALLAPLGPAAAVAWALLVRSAALFAGRLAWRLGRRLAGGSRLGGGLAVVAVLLCGDFLALSAAGAEPALVLLAGLAGLEAWRAGRVGVAVACAVGCALLRVEAWPFLLAGGLVLWVRAPPLRPWIALVAVLVPAAWLVPEWLASGDALRSGARARVPNPGQPALADVPAWAALRAAVSLPPWPLWLGVAGLAVAVVRRAAPPVRAALVPAAAGAAWILIVAAMAQAGFSGEPRYALPGAALLGVSGAAGLGLAARHAGAARTAAIAAVALMAVPAADRLAGLPALATRQAHQWRLAWELGDAIAAAGGRAAVLSCGQPYVGPLRGPLLAYRLHVVKAAVEPDDPPRPPGTVFRSALVAGAAPAPDAPPPFARTGRTRTWTVFAACGLRVP